MRIILLLAVVLLGCQKEVLTPTVKNTDRVGKFCQDLDFNEFQDTWTWRTRQNPNGTIDQLDLWGLQQITINQDSMYMSILAVNWTYMDCSIIDQEGSQYLYVEIYNDTMTWTGLNDGTIWTLTK